MPVAVKIIFTIALVVVAVAFCFIDPQANNAGPGWLWRGGRRDVVRNIICRDDGSFRKYTKQSSLAFWLMWLLLLWFVAPTA